MNVTWPEPFPSSLLSSMLRFLRRAWSALPELCLVIAVALLISDLGRGSVGSIIVMRHSIQSVTLQVDARAVRYRADGPVYEVSVHGDRGSHAALPVPQEAWSRLGEGSELRAEYVEGKLMGIDLSQVLADWYPGASVTLDVPASASTPIVKPVPVAEVLP